MAEPVRVGVIGLGYWGPNLVRNFAEQPRAKVVAVADQSPPRRAHIAARYPGVAVYEEGTSLLEHDDVDAVLVATPPASHYALARAALLAGKHVLVEKPLARTTAEADELIAIARDQSRVLLTDHTFVYTSAVRRIKEALDQRALGRLLYFDSVRINLGLFQRDANVLWDLAVHDLSILSYLLGVPPRTISAFGATHVEGCAETMAYLTCRYDDQLIAHIHANWYAPVKVRRVLIGGSDRMIMYDDVEPVEKVRIYDKGVSVDAGLEGQDVRIQYRTGDMHAPFLPQVEALRRLADHFVECILDGAVPITPGQVGRDVVAVLEAADRSLREGGREIPVSGGPR